ncbi:MAG: c-type cytochrome [Gammaproteobacteria bacterium]|nr:c-type cytochrome [Gammaproteobacteria bacterium]
MQSKSLRWIHLIGVLALLGPPGALRAEGDAARGERLGYTCLGCHGIDNYKNVYPTYSVPRLRGQHPGYLVAALKAYKSQERSHATMHAQAASFSEQDMQDVAAFLAGPVLQNGAAPRGTAPARVTELCVACHGTDGVGLTPDYPNLAGQHADYLVRALHDYQQGNRKNAIMPPFVSQLSEAEIAAVAEYYAAQRPALQTVPRRVTALASR